MHDKMIESALQVCYKLYNYNYIKNLYQEYSYLNGSKIKS
jgi:hypothetical protein